MREGTAAARTGEALGPSPRPVPEWLAFAASAFVVLALIALSVVPPMFNARIDSVRREIENVVEPARTLASEEVGAVAREVGATRGYLLSSDERFLETAREERRNALEAGDRAAALARRLGPEVVERHAALIAAAARWRVYQDDLLDGRLSARDYAARLPQQQALFEAVYDTAALLQSQLAHEASERRATIRHVARQLSWTVAGLGVVAIIASLVVAWLARRERAFARYTDRARAVAERQAAEEHSLKEIMRALGASVSFREVVQQAADRSVELTRAFGAYVEKFDVPERGSEVEVVAVAGRGVPSLGLRVPYPGSLSEELVESGEPQIVTEVGAIGERMAPYLMDCCPGCTALIVPLSSGREVLGTLALLRRHEQGSFSQEEATLARALGDAASAALRRVLLLEGVQKERRSREALLESTDSGIIGVDASGRVTLANHAAATMLGRSRGEMMGRSLHTLIHQHRGGGALPEEECPACAAFHGLAGRRVDSDRFWRKDGSSFPVDFSARPIEQAGMITGAVLSFTDVSERARYEAERERLHAREREARALAENAVHARDDLLSAVSHDLRNPLGAILLTTDVLGRRLPETEDFARRKVEVIGRAAASMDRMIQDLLDVARIERGMLVVERRPTDVAGALSEACTLQRPHAENAGIDLACTAAPGLHPVLADAGRLQQILSNLIGNAVKFTPEGGTIQVTAGPTETGVRFEVADTGKGIPADQLPHLFDRHWQASRADRRGLGLGLTIVKGLVDAHEGSIEVRSAPGQGTVVVFTIPWAAQ